MAGPSTQGAPFLQVVLPKARGLDNPQPEDRLAGGEAVSQVCGVLWARVDSWSCELALLPFRVCAIDLCLALLCAPSELLVGRNQGPCSSLALHTARPEAPSLKGSEVTSSFTPVILPHVS